MVLMSFSDGVMIVFYTVVYQLITEMKELFRVNQPIALLFKGPHSLALAAIPLCGLWCNKCSHFLLLIAHNDYNDNDRSMV